MKTGLKLFNMVNHKPPQERLSEFIGLRLTVAEKRAAEEIAAAENKTLTTLFRELLAERVEKDRKKASKK